MFRSSGIPKLLLDGSGNRGEVLVVVSEEPEGDGRVRGRTIGGLLEPHLLRAGNPRG
jgi:hypothetical protein